MMRRIEATVRRNLCNNKGDYEKRETLLG
jgi:hypothetical protein